jgi:large subunit ribosomal protein L22
MSTARLSNYRQSPRKVRLLADLVRGKSVERALLEIEHAGKRAGAPIAKLIRSAVSNAEKSGAKISNLVVGDIRVEGQS